MRCSWCKRNMMVGKGKAGAAAKGEVDRLEIPGSQVIRIGVRQPGFRSQLLYSPPVRPRAGSLTPALRSVSKMQVPVSVLSGAE